MEDGKTFRVVVTERQLGASTEPTVRDLSEALTGVFGTDYGIYNPTWISRFTDALRGRVGAPRHRPGQRPDGRARAA
jgi:hypothetical protein